MAIKEGDVVIRNLEKFDLGEGELVVVDGSVFGDRKFYIYVGDEFRFLIVIE